MHRKVLVIGLDGATWDLIKQWINSEKLPILREMITNGAYGDLESIIPPTTSPAWPSIYTGRNPAKHGIFDFWSPSGKLVSLRDVKGPKVWNLLSENGIRCGIINVPLTYPPEEINGCMISSLFTPPGKKDFVQPKHIMEILDENGYKIDLEFERYAIFVRNKETYQRRHYLLREIYDMLDRRVKTIFRILETGNYDFFMVNLKEVDEVQHFFWNDKDILLEFWQRIDHYIGAIIDQFRKTQKGAEYYIIILSDHGFGEPPKYVFNLYKWFKKEKSLRGPKLGSMVLSIYLALRGIGIKMRLPVTLKKAIKRVSKVDRFNLVGFSGLKIKDMDDNMREDIIKKLRELKGPDGKSVFQVVCKREEIYRGEFLDKVPDIVFLARPEYQVLWSYDQSEWSKAQSIIPGEHDLYPNGILVVYGDCIKKGKKINGAKIYDITPTVLHIFGVPILEDMDGRVLKEIFKPKSVLDRAPIRRIKISEKEKVRRKIRILKAYGKI